MVVRQKGGFPARIFFGVWRHQVSGFRWFRCCPCCCFEACWQVRGPSRTPHSESAWTDLLSGSRLTPGSSSRHSRGSGNPRVADKCRPARRRCHSPGPGITRLCGARNLRPSSSLMPVAQISSQAPRSTKRFSSAEICLRLGSPGRVPAGISCTVSHLYPTPQHIVFCASSLGGGYHTLKGALATIYARSCIRTSENAPSKTYGE